jgi:hypothetical protein
MSFNHGVIVGFFGNEADPSSTRLLQLDQCLDLMYNYNNLVPDEFRITAKLPPQGNNQSGIVFGYADGTPVGLRKGFLECPWFSTSYNYIAILFVVFVHYSLGCSIYSFDKGHYLTLEEFIPKENFSEAFRAILPDDFRKLLETDRAV